MSLSCQEIYDRNIGLMKELLKKHSIKITIKELLDLATVYISETKPEPAFRFYGERKSYIEKDTDSGPKKYVKYKKVTLFNFAKKKIELCDPKCVDQTYKDFTLFAACFEQCKQVERILRKEEEVQTLV